MVTTSERGRTGDEAEDPRNLVLERVIDVAAHDAWRALTEPDLILQWLTPAPWQTVECDIDLRPGGHFRFVMQSPEGERFPHDACWLEVVPETRLVWTTALLPGFRPGVESAEVPSFTAVIELEPMSAEVTRYRARVVHRNEEDARKHAAMGFEEGWGMALEQLVAAVKRAQVPPKPSEGAKT